MKGSMNVAYAAQQLPLGVYFFFSIILVDAFIDSLVFLPNFMYIILGKCLMYTPFKWVYIEKEKDRTE